MAASRLTAAQLEQWESTGTVSADTIFEPALVEAACAEAAAEGSRFAFPSRAAPTTNELALAPSLVATVHQLLGTTDIRLFQSLVFPAGSADPDRLPTDTGDGPGCRAAALLDPPSHAPEAVHVDIALNSGTVTFVRSDVERPTPGASSVQRCGFRRADCEWIAGESSGWGVSVSGMPRNWVPSLTVEQRNLFSFPPLGSDYWTDDTISAVSHHYASAASGWGGPEGHEASPMDMSEYIAAKTTAEDMQTSSRIMTPPPSLNLENSTGVLVLYINDDSPMEMETDDSPLTTIYQ